MSEDSQVDTGLTKLDARHTVIVDSRQPETEGVSLKTVLVLMMDLNERVETIEEHFKGAVAQAENKRFRKALDRIEQHAYDDDTPSADVLAGFDHMRDIARDALVETAEQEK